MPLRDWSNSNMRVVHVESTDGQAASFIPTVRRQRQRWRSFMPDIFKPGDEVPESGIYRVVHDPVHVGAHEVTAVKGEHFPPCNRCGHHPRFTLQRAAHHIHKHEHFRT